MPVSGSFPWLLGCPLYSKQRLMLLLRIGKEVYWRVVGIFACQLGCADGKMLGGVHPHACLSCLVCAAGHRLGHTACLCANHTCKELGRPGVQCVPLIRDGNGTDFFRYPSHPTPNGTGLILINVFETGMRFFLNLGRVRVLSYFISSRLYIKLILKFNLI